MKGQFSLTSTGLKIVACVAMLVDHIGLLFFPEELLWRVVGRVSFPLFAFLIAEGFARTQSVRAYLFRLLGFAILSQPFYILFRFAEGAGNTDLNIFFTLATGLIALILWNRLSPLAAIPAIALLCGLAEIAGFDYGAYGVVTVLASRLLSFHRKSGEATLLLLPQLYTLARHALGVGTLQPFASMSVPLIASYNGERGWRIPRFAFYSFYPVHLLVLSLISLLAL